MMKQTVTILIFIFLCCASVATSRAGQSPDTARCGCLFDAGEDPVNVTVKLDGSELFINATRNMIVRAGDLIRVQETPKAKLKCDGKEEPVILQSAPRRQAVPCEVKPGQPIQIGNLILGVPRLSSPTMSDQSFSEIPVVLSPRKTSLLDARPRLRWRAIKGVSRYEITIRGQDLNWAKTVVSSAEATVVDIQYPPDGPELKSGVAYKLIVKANGQSSEEEGLAELGFRVLREHEIEEVKNEVAKINKMRLAKTTEQFAVAGFYTSRRLNMDAINLLQASNEAKEDPQLMRLLGDLYLDTDLIRQAEEVYLKIIEPPERFLPKTLLPAGYEIVEAQPKKRKDSTLGQAITYERLGGIYEALGIEKSATRNLMIARALYASLQDKQAVERLTARLSKAK